MDRLTRSGRIWAGLVALAGAAATVVVGGCGTSGTQTSAPPVPPSALLTQAKAVFGVLPDKMPGGEKDTRELAALGERLYRDKGLSVNRSQSCNTCHQVDSHRPGTDSDATSFGALGKRGTRNTNTVFNAGFQFAQFWDGRAKDLAEQAKGPILNPVEMAMPDAKAVETRLVELEYTEEFQKAFPGQAKPVTFDNWAKAVAAFERTLISRSRFDEWLAGDERALTDAEKTGLRTFMEKGCTACHAGSVLGGQMYQKTGLLHAYRDTKDTGRFGITKDPADRMVFKVPILSNVALTAPYFHDGQVATLDDAIREMAWMQVGMKLTADEVKAIAGFLGALNGKGITEFPVSSG